MSRDETVRRYNKIIKKLIDILDTELPGDSIVEGVKRHYTISMVSDKTLIITETGQEIYNYRDVISEYEWTDFKNLESLNDLMNVETVINKVSDAQIFKKILSMLNTIWIKYSDSEKIKIQKYFKMLLSEYSKFILSN